MPWVAQFGKSLPKCLVGRPGFRRKLHRARRIARIRRTNHRG
jgi:hypothetical protein